ncbi:hypothetical protein F5B20DRAFT_489240 [Whalleya microplaca]|nr:hypothetical protein F5B20DRAFT_489240 [Whalleya microplaca]
MTEEFNGLDTLQGPKRRPNRRDPQKRRMQNRAAQRIYRTRTKQHVEALEQIVRAGLQGPDVAAPVASEAATPSNQSISCLPLDEHAGYTQSQVTYSIPHSEMTLLESNPLHDTSCAVAPDMLGLISQDATVDTRFSGLVTAAAVSICNCSNPHQQYLSSFPSPYMSNIRIDIVCVVAALQENCLQLGITEHMVCSSNTESPFYRPGALQSRNPVGLMESTRRLFQTVKPDLRPSETQIVQKHHPYIDVIPFPDIRDALIRMGADINEDDFFVDYLSGLRCWGGAGGGTSGTGTPWDMRSWDASPWFLAKWKHVVGEDGALARQSSWWRDLRGETMDSIPQ